MGLSTIFSFFESYLGKGVVAGIVALLVAGVAWKIEIDIEALGSAKATISELQSTAKANKKLQDKMAAEAKKEQAQADAQIQADQAALNQQSAQERIINASPQTDRGPVPGVILNTINSLYNSGSTSSSAKGN